jgi:hypothetical protein
MRKRKPRSTYTKQMAVSYEHSVGSDRARQKCATTANGPYLRPLEAVTRLCRECKDRAFNRQSLTLRLRRRCENYGEAQHSHA